jgi:glycosyltransferase involved in cell wall biosynthesis
MKNKKLVIISHTEHYLDEHDVVKGWGSTVTEVNFLADYWEEIVHVACLYKIPAPKSSLPYTRLNIKFVPIPPFGGKKIIDKFLIFLKIPIILSIVFKAIRKATEVQLRLPTSIGLFLLPFFTIMFSRKFTLWVKYAGNWNQLNAPYSYRIQKFWLKRNLAKCKVTINGFWDNQPEHCLSFENPCLTQLDIQKGINIASNKNFKAPFVFCFVGRLEEAKGVHHIIKALKRTPTNKINKVHFVGDSNQIEQYKNELEFIKGKVFFHGFLVKQEVHSILQESHFILLPSASEGFPKVVAEAACYGTIPVVSNVGSIPHYITNENGFVWDINGKTTFDEVLGCAIEKKEEELNEMSQKIVVLAKKFTFDNYIKKLKGMILK